MRKGSTSFGACEVRCWRWLFGNKIPVSLHPNVHHHQLLQPGDRVTSLCKVTPVILHGVVSSEVQNTSFCSPATELLYHILTPELLHNILTPELVQIFLTPELVQNISNVHGQNLGSGSGAELKASARGHEPRQGVK